MSDVFPKWTNRLPRNIIVAALLVGSGVAASVTYYFTPKYTRVGYEPMQPVAFPHSVHVEQLGLDCRYCHNTVEKSWYSNIPATARLALVRESAASGEPIPWVQIHKMPDYVYFNHSVHVNRGVSCVECHGKINRMDEVYHDKPLSMSYCLTCHRDPAMRVRPLAEITHLDWKPESAAKQREDGTKMVHDLHIQSLQNCSTCHR